MKNCGWIMGKYYNYYYHKVLWYFVKWCETCQHSDCVIVLDTWINKMQLNQLATKSYQSNINDLFIEIYFCIPNKKFNLLYSELYRFKIISINHIPLRNKIYWIYTYQSFVNKSDERSSFDFDLMSVTIEKLYHEMEKVGFSQIGRWLFREIDSSKATPEKRNMYWNGKYASVQFLACQIEN